MATTIEYRPYIPRQVTRGYIERTVSRLSELYGLQLYVDWTSNRPRVVSTAGGGNRDISLRYSLKDLGTWLIGFEEGLMAMQHSKLFGYKPTK